ncbi:hypothetical protein QFC19_008293 [Naganishia cerealis]|uniref:Uncharacterized protein n=1 Tax=Naganishia cerealis TaxID=610337 RepID=A0ACC2V4I9_9TREE|nr:hypothetical protein QFC19_008293 [Naganishia cerealis]
MSNHKDATRDPDTTLDQAYPPIATVSNGATKSTNERGGKSAPHPIPTSNTIAATSSNINPTTSATASQQSSISGVSTALASTSKFAKNNEKAEPLGRRRSSRLSHLTNKVDKPEVQSNRRNRRFAEAALPAEASRKTVHESIAPSKSSSPLTEESSSSESKGKKRERDTFSTNQAETCPPLPPSKRARPGKPSPSQKGVATSLSKTQAGRSKGKGKEPASSRDISMSAKGKAKAGSSRKGKLPKRERMASDPEGKGRVHEQDDDGVYDRYQYDEEGDFNMNDFANVLPKSKNAKGKRFIESGRKSGAASPHAPALGASSGTDRTTRSKDAIQKALKTKTPNRDENDSEASDAHDSEDGFDMSMFEADFVHEDDEDDDDDDDDDHDENNDDQDDEEDEADALADDVGDKNTAAHVPKPRPRSANATRTGDKPAGGHASSAMERLQEALRAEGFGSAGSQEAAEAFLRDARGLFGGFYGLGGFGAGGPSGSSKWKRIIKDLKSPKANVRMDALNEAVNELAISTEDQLVSFPLDAAIKEFIAIMDGKPNIDREAGDENIDHQMDDFGGEDAELAAVLAMSAGGAMPDEEDQQAQIIACRCLANLMEAMPHSAHTIVAHGAVKVLCSKLLEIQYIELAEQALSTLKNISKETGSAIVRGGGLGAMLNFLDFFSTHVQQTALSAAANCCRNISPEYFPMIRDVFPVVRNVLGYPDSKLVEQACTIVIRTLESYRHRADLLEQLLDADTIRAINLLLLPGGGSSALSAMNYTLLVKALTTATRASPTVTIALYEAEVHNSLYHSLTGVLPSAHEEVDTAPTPAEAVIMQNIGQKPKEQIEEVLSLVCEILPPFSKEGVFDARNYSERMLARYKEGKARLAKEATDNDRSKKSLEDVVQAMRTRPTISTKASDTPPAEPSNSELSGTDNFALKAVAAVNAVQHKREADRQYEQRTELLKAKSDVVIGFIRVMLPVLVEVYGASAATKVRIKVLGAISRAIAFCDEDKLQHALKSVPLASFLSSILSNRDNAAFVLGALQIIELLLMKMPEIYSRSFHREGVFFEVERLAKETLSPTAKSSQREQLQLKEQSGSARRLLDKTSTEDATTLTPQIHSTKTSGNTNTLSKSRKVSSVPSDPHDVNIVRARIICIKANLGDDAASESARLQTSPAASIVKRLNESDLSLDAFRSSVQAVALALTDMSEPLSSFELLQSGLLDKLVELIADSETPIVHARRRALFDELARGNGENTALLALIKRLQESLSRMESFEVESASSGLEESKGSSLNNLVRQIRLRLVADEGTDVPRVCKDMVVSVQAIAPLSAINSWLRSRVVSINNGGTGAANGLSSMLEAAYASRFNNQNNSTSSGPANVTSTKSGKKEEPVGSHDTNKPKSSASGDAHGSQRKSARLQGKGPDETDVQQSTKKDASLDTVALKTAVRENSHSRNKDDDNDLHDNDEDMDDGDEEDHEDMDDEGDSDMEDDYEDVIFEDDMGEDMEDDIDRPQEQTVDLSMPDDGSKPEATTPSGTRVATPTNETSAAESSKAADLPPKLGSYAAAVRAPPSDWHFQFHIGDDELSMSDTVYGALHRTQSVTQTGKPKQSIFWQQPVIKFKKVDGPPRALGIQPDAPPIVEPGSTSALPASLPVESAQATVLRMLRVLHALNTEREDSQLGNGNEVDEAAFINPKLTAKFTRQLEELVIVASNCLPDWAIDLPNHFPFLFPFEARYTYLQSTSFGYSRLVGKWIAQQGPTESNRRLGMLDVLPRVQRSRVRISRHKMLESATRVMELYGSSPGVLEIEYQDEEGTGLGPTLEFYTLVSKAFAERRLRMWRDEDESVGEAYVHHPHGLFPRPLNTTDALQHPAKSDYPLFKSLGTFIGKALLDSRIIDINLNKVFLRALMGEVLPLDSATVRQVDPTLARTIDKMETIVNAKLAIQNDGSLDENEKKQRVNDLRLDGVEISDLGLDFVLPGASDIELTTNGASVPVTVENIEDYISAILDYTLRKGISRQVEAFREGFSMIFPVSDLAVFSPSELVLLFGNPEEDWSRSTLEQAIKADHGYNADSKQIRYLIDVMASFDKEERRAFLQFVTGAPKLPIGGFKGLHPQFTVVRKPHEPPLKPDQYLPSVMTCAQYFKMPEYSSREVLSSQIRKAMREGANAFLLS